MTDIPYQNPLVLTSPHMRGVRVRNAQYLLAGHNAWSDNEHPIHTYKGAIDGDYGPTSSAATKMAKYWLGYPSKECDGRFGYLVYNLLKGISHISAENAKRRQTRLLALEDQHSIKLKAFKLAETFINTDESPFGSNCQKFGAWYGMNCVPWCAIFVSYNISHSGKPWKYSYVPDIVEDARRGRNGMMITSNPVRGDLVAYTIGGNVNCHVAFFDEWLDGRNYNFHDLGGNTGPTSVSNGGSVLRQVRHLDMVSRFVRLNF